MITSANAEKLFLQCDSFRELEKCFVPYRLGVPFQIPCRSVHPDVNVIANSPDAKKVYSLNLS